MLFVDSRVVSIAPSSFPGLPSLLRHWQCQISSRLGCLLRLRRGWVSDQFYCIADTLQSRARSTGFPTQILDEPKIKNLIIKNSGIKYQPRRSHYCIVISIS